MSHDECGVNRRIQGSAYGVTGLGRRDDHYLSRMVKRSEDTAEGGRTRAADQLPQAQTPSAALPHISSGTWLTSLGLSGRRPRPRTVLGHLGPIEPRRWYPPGSGWPVSNLSSERLLGSLDGTRRTFERLIAPGMRSKILPTSVVGWVLAVNGAHATGEDGRDDDNPYGEERPDGGTAPLREA